MLYYGIPEDPSLTTHSTSSRDSIRFSSPEIPVLHSLKRSVWPSLEGVLSLRPGKIQKEWKRLRSLQRSDPCFRRTHREPQVPLRCPTKPHFAPSAPRRVLNQPKFLTLIRLGNIPISLLL